MQRRAAYASKNIQKGDKIKKLDVVFLRPCPKNSFTGFDEDKLYGKRARRNIRRGELINFKCLT